MRNAISLVQDTVDRVKQTLQCPIFFLRFLFECDFAFFRKSTTFLPLTNQIIFLEDFYAHVAESESIRLHRVSKCGSKIQNG